tara:strand:- start:10498 stop:10884 length:387 start_codon:yes stop_codon:yes gene_type:complete
MPSIVLPADKEQVSREPLAEGKYNFEIIGAEFSQTQNGNDVMEIQLREVNDSRRVWTKLFFTPAAGWKIKSLLKAAGCEITEGQALDINEEYVAGNLVGKKVAGEVEIKEYNDKKRNDIKRFSVSEPF